MNIVLIGMRGTGKTTVGKIIATKLMRGFLETDKIIQDKAKMNIQEIVEKKGWKYFRDLESEVVKEVSLQRNSVIATGGGIILRSDNTEALSKNGVLYLLTADVRTMLMRIGDDPNRPSLSGKTSRKDDIETTWQERARLYEDAADETIDTGALTKAKVVESIIANFKEKYAN